MASWAAFRRYVSSLQKGPEPFARAYRAVETHDVEGLRDELDRWPDLVSARGTNGNDLLGMATATCNEQLVSLLLERGADPARRNVHGWTPLHQAAQAGMIPLARLLLEAGAPADVSARGDGGTPLIAALFWGKRDMAEVLAHHGVFPRNLRAAAGLEEIDLIEELVSKDGRVTSEAGAHRDFYRPHSGFPPWRPSGDPQEVVDEALSWASRNDRVESITFLVRRGARIDADVYRGTALAWAAACGCLSAVGRLLELGADPNSRTTFGGPGHGLNVTAMHLAAQSGHIEVIKALLEAEADPTLRDALYDSTPAGWAEHEGQPAALELLRARDG
jgi:ankyrin repeat protein